MTDARRMNPLSIRSAITPALVALSLAGALPLSRSEAASARPYPGCTASELSFSLDDENGAFNGMSQSGTLLVLRNISASPCRIQALPHLHFGNRNGRIVAADRRSPPGMHPGPVMLPVAFAPEAELTARLHWVASDAYGAGNCVTPDIIMLDVSEGTLHQRFARQMCAPAHSVQFFDQAPLRSDPPLPATVEQHP